MINFMLRCARTGHAVSWIDLHRGPGSAPDAAERPPLGKRSHERFEEHLDGCDDILKGLRCVGLLGLPDEPLPLNLLGLVIHERRIEGRGLDGNRRISVLERFFDGLGQHLPLEVKRAGQHPDVAKVLHPAVQDTELHHGMELFGDDARMRQCS